MEKRDVWNDLIRYCLEAQARSQIISQLDGTSIEEKDLNTLVTDMVERGCVVRSLEAVTGQTATISDYMVRLDYIRKHPKSRLIEDIHNIPSLLDQLSLSKSPLGIALSKLAVRAEEFSPEQIKEELEQGKKVICCFVRQSNDDSSAHACCLDIDSRGGFLQKSDRLGAFSPSIDLPSGKYHVFIFSERILT